MRLGDLLEWLGGAALIAAAYLQLGLAAALGAAGVFLIYQAQCYGATPLRGPRPDREE